MDPFGMLTSLLRRSTLGEQTILELDLDFGVLSAQPENPIEALRALNAPTMKALIEGLREAADDEAIGGLIVHVGTCPLSATQIEELGDAIEAFADRKPAWSYTEAFGEIGTSLHPYLLAVRCGRVWLQPSGQVALGGVRAQVTLLRGVFDKVGIAPEFGQRHEFKTAADSYVAHEISEANREMTQRLADSVAEQAFGLIARRRRLDEAAVRSAVDAGMLTPEEAKTAGLIDRIGYRDEVYSAARSEWGGEANLRYVHRYTRRSGPAELLAQRTKPAIGVVTIRGGIVSGRPQRPASGGQPRAASEVVCQQLRAAARDPLVKAVVLRVDSPGGSYIASDAIRREVQQVRATGRPVVASMGDLAASGGYFVSMPADEIVANPSTLTGSIGVLAGKFVVDGLKQKLGLLMADLTSGPWATFMSANSPFSEEQWAALNRRLDDIYADFTAKAAADRRMDLSTLEPLARGRVWTGADAKQRGLVDHLGGLQVALERASALAGLDLAQTVVRPVSPVNFFTQFRPADSSEAAHATAVLPGPVVGLDALIEAVGARLGLDAPGVLTMPLAIQFR